MKKELPSLIEQRFLYSIPGANATKTNKFVWQIANLRGGPPIYRQYFSMNGGETKMAAVLIVDDTMFMRASIKQMLTANGHTVAGEASNGIEAVEKYVEVKPDVVLMDITMPDMDGLEALRLIKEKDPAAKVVMCTAMGQQAMVARAVELGAQQFIVKPFQADRLMQAIDTVCGK